MKKNVYDGKTNIGGIGVVEAPYTPHKAPAGKVITGNDLRTGKREHKNKK